MDENLTRDLFGGVTTLPSGRRGRPSHRWSQSNADRVILGLALGYSDEQIASGLGVSVPTLRKYYFSDLKRREMQRTRFELWRAEVLAKEAGEGNVGAMRELGKIVEKRDRRLAEERMKGAGDGQASTAPVGKKEAARRRAEKLEKPGGSGWGDLLRPGGEVH